MRNIHAVGPVDNDRADACSSAPQTSPGNIVIIDHRTLIRDCLARCIGDLLGRAVATFADKSSWERLAPRARASLIVVGGMDDARYDEWDATIRALGAGAPTAPVVILSDMDDKDRVASSLRCGARAYIPCDTPLEIAIEALRLVLAGGSFVPPNILQPEPEPEQTGAGSDAHASGKALFTARETAVIEALREGKANKLIASDLRLSESTVKAHIHNVMKKLCVSNRTQAVVRIAELANDGERSFNRFLIPDRG